MKKTQRIWMAAALLLTMVAGCGKPVAYDSFELSVAMDRTDGAKTTWSHNGLFWRDGDVVCINGDLHTVHGSGESWHTEAPHNTSALDDGNFYIASPTGGGGWNEGSRTYGPLDFSGSRVPLACVGKTNKLTLYPCCAVIKLEGMDNGAVIELYETEDLEDVVEVPMRGSIDIAGRRIVGGSNRTYALTQGEVSNGSTYMVVPMEGNSLTAALFIYDDDGNEGITSQAVTLTKGTLYVVDPANF